MLDGLEGLGLKGLGRLLKGLGGLLKGLGGLLIGLGGLLIGLRERLEMLLLWHWLLWRRERQHEVERLSLEVRPLFWG